MLDDTRGHAFFHSLLLHRLRPIVVVIFSALLISSLGCRNHEKRAPLRIVLNPWPGYAALLLAERQGLFRAQGVDVELIKVPDLSKSIEVFKSHAADGIAGSLIEISLIAKRTHNKPLIVMFFDFSQGADVILGRHGIDSPRALKGQRIAVERGTLGEFLLARALQSAGLSLNSVTTVNLRQHEMKQAFLRGEIDAMVSYLPNSIRLATDLPVQEIFTSADIPGEILDVLAFPASLIESRSAEILKLLRAYDTARQFLEERPAEAAQILEEMLEIPQSHLTETYRLIHILDPCEEIALLNDTPRLENTLALTAEFTDFSPLPIRDLISREFLKILSRELCR